MLRTLKGIVVGTMAGVAISAVVLPQLDRKTQKNLKRVSRRAMNMAEDAFDMFVDYVK